MTVQTGTERQAQRTSGYAVAGLVLSIVGLFGLGSIAGIVLSAIGYRDIKNGAAVGKGIAVAGIVIGVLTLAFSVWFIGSWWASMAGAY